MGLGHALNNLTASRLLILSVLYALSNAVMHQIGGWLMGLAANAVALVSFMALCRQDTDVNKLTWWNHDTVLSELTFRAVKHGL